MWAGFRKGCIVGLILAAIAHFFIWYGARRAGVPFHINIPFATMIVLLSGAIGAVLSPRRDK